MKKIIIINIALLIIVTGCATKKLNTEYVNINIGDEKASVIASEIHNDTKSLVKKEYELINTDSFNEAEKNVKSIIKHLDSLEQILEHNINTFSGEAYFYYINQLKCTYSSLNKSYKYILKSMEKERKNSSGNVKEFIYTLREHGNVIFMEEVSICINNLRNNTKN